MPVRPAIDRQGSLPWISRQKLPRASPPPTECYRIYARNGSEFPLVLTRHLPSRRRARNVVAISREHLAKRMDLPCAGRCVTISLDPESCRKVPGDSPMAGDFATNAPEFRRLAGRGP